MVVWLIEGEWIWVITMVNGGRNVNLDGGTMAEAEGQWLVFLCRQAE